MNGAFRHEPMPVFGDRLANLRSWWQRCRTVRADGFLVTSWEANRLALETTTVVDAAAASLWLEPGTEDATSMLAAGLQRVFPSSHSRSLARLLLAADEHAFSGYARWQINEGWSLCAGSEGLKKFHAEVRFFLRASRHQWPKALAASLAFRLYLAQRDVFVREAARAVFRLRRLIRSGKPVESLELLRQLLTESTDFAARLRAGRRAAKIMWSSTRSPNQAAPNLQGLKRDEQQLAEWKTWLRRARRDLNQVWSAAPVCGAWQLQFVVHNFAPAVQRVSVEQQNAEGTWQELAGRHTIEFRAVAARERTKIRREFNVPVHARSSALRIVARGVGQVGISQVALTDGVDILHAGKVRTTMILGERAKAHGFPEINLESNNHLLLSFVARGKMIPA